MPNKEELLRKMKALKVLAERGESGEKESAQEFIYKLIKKYGISESELEEETRRECYFAYREQIEARLLNQIIYMTTGKAGFKTRGTKSKREHKKIGALCTVTEQIEIEAAYKFYKEALKEELHIFMCAFMNKNYIFPPEAMEEQEDIKLTKEDFERLEKLDSMMGGMERHTMRQIEEK